MLSSKEKKLQELKDKENALWNSDYVMTDSENLQLLEEYRDDMKYISDKIADEEKAINQIVADMQSTKTGNLWFNYKGHRYTVSFRSNKGTRTVNTHKVTRMWRDGVDFKDDTYVLKALFSKAVSKYVKDHPTLTVQTLD